MCFVDKLADGIIVKIVVICFEVSLVKTKNGERKVSPVTHVFEWANIADKVRRNLFMEFAEVGAKHLVLTCEMIMNCIQKNPYINIYRKDMADA